MKPMFLGKHEALRVSFKALALPFKSYPRFITPPTTTLDPPLEHFVASFIILADIWLTVSAPDKSFVPQ